MKNSLISQKQFDNSKLSKAGTRLSEALKALLEEKDFNSITTAEIARYARANESLIYRYFEDKRGLLHFVLAEYLKKFLLRMEQDLSNIHNPLEKLKEIIRSTIYFYNNDLVFAKILLLEVRNYPGYYKSPPYEIIKIYTDNIVQIVEEAVEEGLLRKDIPPNRIMQIILGSIEHLFLPKILFGYDIDPDTLASQAYEGIFKGLINKEE